MGELQQKLNSHNEGRHGVAMIKNGKKRANCSKGGEGTRGA